MGILSHESNKIAVDAKMFYQEFDAGSTIHMINEYVLRRVVLHCPKNALEFGCNNGKNIQRLKDLWPYVDIVGIDVSRNAVQKAISKGLCVGLGDELFFNDKADDIFDMIFTISVLCHIPDIDNLITQMQRCSKRIIIAETNERLGRFYFSHDYKKYGFVSVMEIYAPPNPVGNGALYHIMEWSR